MVADAEVTPLCVFKSGFGSLFGKVGSRSKGMLVKPIGAALITEVKGVALKDDRLTRVPS